MHLRIDECDRGDRRVGIRGRDCTDSDSTETLTWALIGGPTKGIIDFRVDGNFIYTASPDAIGPHALTAAAS